MSNPKVKVSVLISVYNGENFLNEAIESILGQTFQDFELIIIDDGSTDKSSEIIRSYKDDRIKFYQNGENKGITYSRNRSIECSTGEFLAILDCDDIAMPSRLKEQLNFLESHPDFGMIGSWVEHIDKNGYSLHTISRYKADPEETACILLFHNFFTQSSVTIRRSALKGLKYRMDFPVSEDYDMWVRIARTSKVWNLPKVLVKYRVHQNNISKEKASLMDLKDIEILREQLSQLGQFTEREINVCFETGRRGFNRRDISFKELEEVFYKIYYANKTNLKYKEEVLLQVLSAQLNKIIYSSGIFNLEVLHSVNNSPWGKYFYVSNSKFKFIRKCLKGSFKNLFKF